MGTIELFKVSIPERDSGKFRELMLDFYSPEDLFQSLKGIRVNFGCLVAPSWQAPTNPSRFNPSKGFG